MRAASGSTRTARPASRRCSAAARFIDATGRFEAATSVNPLSLLGEEKHWPYVADWVKLVIEGEDYTLHADSKKPRFTTAFGRLATAYAREDWRLSGLITLLPAELRERLHVWTEGQKNGRFFDHVEDGFALSDDLSIEMGDLFQNYPGRGSALHGLRVLPDRADGSTASATR